MNKIPGKTIFFICIAIGMVLLMAVTLSYTSLFIKANEYSDESRILNRAVLEASSIAETLKASNGNLNEVGPLMKEHRLFDVTENTLVLYYDENLKPTLQSNSAHKAVIKKTSLSHCCEYNITILETRTDTKIYQLSFKSVYTGENIQ